MQILRFKSDILNIYRFFDTIFGMKYRKIAIIAGIIFVLLCAALYIFIYTIPEITGALTPTVVVEYGEMRIVEPVSAVIVRDEQVYNAENSGNINYYIENNTKTRRSIKILDIYGSETTPVYCPETGVLSYYYDGYESILTPDTLDNVDTLIASDEKTQIDVQNITKETVKTGDPIYKLITSDTWYIVGIVPAEDSDKYSEGSSFTIEFETGSVLAKINRVVVNNDTALVIASTSKYFADYDKIRQCTVNFVLRDDKGIIIPNSAIIMKNGNPGVYVKKIDGDYVFTRIKAINTDGVNSVVYADTFSVLRADGLTDTVNTISIYDEILKDASNQN